MDKKIVEQLKQSPLYAGSIPSQKSIHLLANKPKDGEIYHIIEEDQFYVWKEGRLQSLQSAFEGFKMSLYDINKMAIEQLEPVPREKIKSLIYDPIVEFEEKNLLKNYFMLLCKELSYYTVFHRESNSMYINLAEGVMDCLDQLGDIYDVEYKEETNGIEIWIKTYSTSEVIVMYLFPYDEGVCTIGG